MPTRDEVQAVLERVKTAAGPDLEIDAGIALIAGWYVDGEDNWIGPHAEIAVPYYTSSIDAIVALIEKELPGWRISFNGTMALAQALIHEDRSPFAEADRGDSGPLSMPAPLALCAAFLSAKLFQMQEGE